MWNWLSTSVCTFHFNYFNVDVLGGAPAYLRGCVDEFYGKDDSAKLPTVTEEKPVCTSAASSEGNSSKVYDIILYCMSQEASPPCNMRISSDDQPLNTLNCVEGSSRTCTYCSWFDDKGSCKHNNKGECRGVYCTKVVGKFGGKLDLYNLPFISC